MPSEGRKLALSHEACLGSPLFDPAEAAAAADLVRRRLTGSSSSGGGGGDVARGGVGGTSPFTLRSKPRADSLSSAGYSHRKDGGARGAMLESKKNGAEQAQGTNSRPTAIAVVAAYVIYCETWNLCINCTENS